MLHARMSAFVSVRHLAKGNRFLGSFSSGFDPSVSQVTSSAHDGLSDTMNISGFNSVGEEMATKFKSYAGSLPSYPRWYELPLDTCRIRDPSKVPSCG